MACKPSPVSTKPSAGHLESFNAKLRDELLDVEIFSSLIEATTVGESWRRNYNTRRQHSSLRGTPPAVFYRRAIHETQPDQQVQKVA